MCYEEISSILPPQLWPASLRRTLFKGHPNYADRFELVKMFAFAGVAPRVCVRVLYELWGDVWDAAAVRHVQGLCGGRGKLDAGEVYAHVIAAARVWWCFRCDPTRAVRHKAYEYRPHVVAAVLTLQRNGNHRKARLLQDECWLDSDRPWSFFVYNET